MPGSSKHYGHEQGFSCAFRQWRADSHCRFVHGYALAFTLWFDADTLDERNWVVDFGSLKGFKQMLADTFDHKTVVAVDDPQIEWFREGHKLGVLDLIEVPATGCEKFAEWVFEVAEIWLRDNGYGDRVRVKRVRVAEHGANAAYWPDCP